MRLSINLSSLDRVFRFTVGAVCIYLGFFEGTLIPNQMVAIVIGVFGVINVFASFTAYCPVYAACGISTSKKSKTEEA